MTQSDQMHQGNATTPKKRKRNTREKVNDPLYKWFLLPLTYGLFKLILLAVERMTASQAYGLARGIALIFWALSPRHRKIAYRNLELAYGDRYSDRERRVLVREVFQHFFMTTFDMLLVPRVSRDGKWQDVLKLTPEQHDTMQRAAESSQPVAFHTGHMGSWEFSAGAASFFGVRLDFVYRPLDHPQIDEEVRKFRTFFGNRVYSKQGALRGYTRTLREGGWLGVIADQNAGRRAAYLDFFGIATSTETSHFRLYQRFKPRVLAFFAIRDGFNFRFHGEGFFETHVDLDADPLEEELRLGQWYLKCVEEVARKYPAQYLWTHKRFTSRPPQVRSLYEHLGQPLDPELMKAQPSPPIPPRNRREEAKA